MKKIFSAALALVCVWFASPALAALPSGYTELEYLENTSSEQYIMIPYHMTSNDDVKVKFLITARSTEAANCPYGVTSSASATNAFKGAFFTSSGTGAYNRVAYGNGVDTNVNISGYDSLNTWYEIEQKPDGTNYINGHLVATIPTSTWTAEYNFALFGRSTAGTKTLAFIGRIAYCKIGTAVDLIPAKRNSDGVLGMYDTVNNRFYTNAGTGEFVAGAPVTDNSCRNLFDKNNALLGMSVNAQGVFEHNADYNCSNYIPVQNGKTYIRSRNGVAFGVRYHLYDNNKDWLGSQDAQTTGLIEVNNPLAKYVAFAISANFDLSTIQLEQGSTATPYQPYNPSCGCDGTIVNYTSATGTVSQSGTPTPDNPIDPVFYQQGNMVLRKVGDVADSYDATTGKITRRVGVKVFDGTEDWRQGTNTNTFTLDNYFSDIKDLRDNNVGLSPYYTVFSRSTGIQSTITNNSFGWNTSFLFVIKDARFTELQDFQTWLREKNNAGAPVTVWYPLKTETTEDWTESQYCNANESIKIATTKYNETKFSPLNTALANAISVVDSVVTQTITQAGRIADLQAQKQTRPADDPTDANNAENCPAGKKCLLVEDASGVPHWYEIVENAWDLPAGYTQLEYIESTGTQWINTGNVSTGSDRFVSLWNSINANGNRTFYAASNGSIATGERSLFWMDSGGVGVDVVWPTGADTGKYQHIAGAWGASGDYLFDDNLTSFTYNGTSVSRSVSRNFTSRYNLFLFAVSRNGVDPIAVSIVRLKYFKWYRNDELIHEYIPAKNADGVVGMYDTVEGRFFTNAGDGEFIAGPVAE